MTRAKKLEPKAREIIKQKLYEMGEVETEVVMDVIRPHYLFNALVAKEREIRRTAQQMMSGMRDEKGIRSVFACNVDGVSKYVNIDMSGNPDSLRGVDAQLRTKLEGLKASSAKASKRRMELEGQLRLDLNKISNDGQ